MSGRPTPDEAAELLGRTEMFARVKPDDRRRVAAACVSRHYARGQYLCYQGDPGDRLFVLGDGMVKVVFTSEQGDEIVLATLRPPEVFGELAALTDEPRSASVVAVDPTRVLMLSRASLSELLRTSPELVDAVLAALGGMVARLTEQAADLAFLDLGGRLAKVLVRLAESSGGTLGAPVVIDMRLSQSDLAAMVGASRPAVNRALQALAARRLLEVSGQVITLNDIAALRRRAGA